MSIQRWNFYGIKDDSGQIVNYADHVTEMQRVTAENAALRAKLVKARRAVSLLMLELRPFGFSDSTIQAIINPPAPKETA